jgi:hypothetical protein
MGTINSQAFASIAWASLSKPGHILVTYHSGAVYAYQAKPQEYALMHRRNVSAGRYLNRVLKKRGGIELKAKPLKQPTKPRLVTAEVAVLSAQFNQMTGLV